MKKNLYFLSFLLLGSFSRAQLNNSFLYTANSDSLIDKNAKFGFYIDNVNYIRNSEYHSIIEDGATWAGTQIWPQATYRYNNNMVFKAGVFVQKDFGNHKFRTLIPTYTLSYTKKNLKVNFGTLDGSLDHNLIEPLYAMENFIDKRIENGLQFKGSSKKLRYDVWIDWEKMIYRNSTTPEKFTTGLSSDLILVNKSNFKLSFPFQGLLRHQGGEIYAEPHSNIKTQLNLAYGIHLTKAITHNIIDKVDFQAYVTFYEDMAPSKADSFFDGNGQYFALTFSKKNLGLMLNYWDAHQFISPNGEPLYLSKSRVNNDIYIQYRKMAMLRILYEVRVWPNLMLVARLNNIYNFSEKQFDNVVEVYAKFNIGSQLLSK